jgi:hypothetical protein
MRNVRIVCVRSWIETIVPDTCERKHEAARTAMCSNEPEARPCAGIGYAAALPDAAVGLGLFRPSLTAGRQPIVAPARVVLDSSRRHEALEPRAQ